MNVVTARGLHTRRGATEVLRGVDLEVYGGEVVAVVGPSGSGKTTLLRALNYLTPFTAGEVEIAGHALRPGMSEGADARRDGVPELQPLPALERARERDRGAAARARARRGGRRGAGARAARARRARGPRGRVPADALGRAAAARGDRTGARHGAGGDALRRADLRPRSASGR